MKKNIKGMLFVFGLVWLFPPGYATAVENYALNGNGAYNLRFAWPKNKTFKMDFLFEDITRRGGRKVSVKMNGTGKVSTKAHSKGLQVDYTDGKINTRIMGMGHSLYQKKLQEFLMKLGEIDSGYVIGSNGKILDVVNFGVFHKKIKGYFDSVFQDIPESPEKNKAFKLAKRMTSKDHLLTTFKREWHRDVEQWIGTRLTPKKRYQFEEIREVAQLNNAKVPFRVNFSYIGKTTCNVEELDERCVEIYIESVIDQESLEKVLEEFSKASDDKSLRIAAFRKIISLSIVTEPDTLLPHKTKWVSKTIQINEAGIRTRKTQKQEKTYWYN